MFVCFFGLSQEGEFRATIVNDPFNPTPSNLVPGTPINLRLEISGYPNWCAYTPFGYPSPQSHLSFRLNFYAVDVNTNQEYFLHTQKFVFNVPNGETTWTGNNPVITSSFTVHPCIPTGDYTLKAHVVSLTQFDGCATKPDDDFYPFSSSSSDVYIGATDITDNQLYWCSFMGEDIYRTELCNDQTQNTAGSAVDCWLYDIIGFHVDNPNAGSLSASINVIAHQCPTTFDLQAVVSGGTPAFQYDWFYANMNSPNIQSIGTEYNYVIVTDAEGCKAMAEVDLGAASHFDYPHGVLITSSGQQLDDDNGDGIIRIKGAIKIAENVNYSINNIQFSAIQFIDAFNWEDDARFYTKSGIWLAQKSTLTINDMLITNVPTCGNMWQGIKVQGHATNRQQGAKLVLNNTTIEHAHIGVNSGDYKISKNTQTAYILNGIVEATNSTFRNNNIGINFADSHGENMPSFVLNCDFICDAPLLENAKYHGNGSSVFINLINTRSLPIKACNFTGNLAFTEELRGTAIRSYNSNYRVTSGFVAAILTPNVFTNLSRGIDIYSSGSLTDVVQVKDNRFYGVMQGITASNSNFDEISFNEFLIPEGLPDLHSWGLNLQACDGFMVTENIFNTLPNSNFSYTYGNISRNISETGGQVYRNQFPGLFQVATQTEQKSTSLQMTCNTYLNENRYDWAITSGNIFAQGTTSIPAGNQFFTCTSNDESQIFKNNVVPAFDYYCFSQAEFHPTCYSNGVNLEFPGVEFGSSNCTQQVELPAGFILGGGNSNAPGKGKGNNNGLTNAEYNQLKARKIRQDLREGNLNGVIGLIANSTDQKDIKKLVPTYLAIGDCIKARQKLNQIDRSTTEGNEFYLLHDVLVNACAYGRKLKDLNQQEIDQVEQIKNNSNTRIKTGAESVLALKNENQYLRYAEPIVTSSQLQEQNAISSKDEKESSFIVYPNPSEGEVSIQTSIEKGTLQIVDALGRVHVTKIISDKETLNLKLETGIYIISFVDELGNVEPKQLFIQK